MLAQRKKDTGKYWKKNNNIKCIEAEHQSEMVGAFTWKTVENLIPTFIPNLG